MNRRYYSKRFFIIITLFYLVACNNKQDLRGYYFPINELKQGLVYEYRPINNDSLPVMYWYYKTTVKGNDVYLTGVLYNQYLQQQQLNTEQIVENGALTKDIFLYGNTSDGKQLQVPVKVIRGNTFPFEVTDSNGVFLYEINWKNPIDSTQQTSIIRNRRFMGFENVEWQGKQHQAVHFSLKELQDDIRDGHLELNFYGKELFVKDIGLVYFDRSTKENGLIAAYKLYDRYPMKALEDKAMKMK